MIEDYPSIIDRASQKAWDKWTVRAGWEKAGIIPNNYEPNHLDQVTEAATQPGQEISQSTGMEIVPANTATILAEFKKKGCQLTSTVIGYVYKC